MCVRVSARAPLSFVSLISFIFLFLYRRIHWRRFATSLNPKQIVSFKLITDSSILVMARIKAAVAHKWYLSFPWYINNYLSALIIDFRVRPAILWWHSLECHFNMLAYLSSCCATALSFLSKWDGFFGDSIDMGLIHWDSSIYIYIYIPALRFFFVNLKLFRLFRFFSGFLLFSLFGDHQEWFSDSRPTSILMAKFVEFFCIAGDYFAAIVDSFDAFPNSQILCEVYIDIFFGIYMGIPVTHWDYFKILCYSFEMCLYFSGYLLLLNTHRGFFDIGLRF